MKIEEDDLKKLFENDHDSFKVESKGQKILVKKIKSTNEIKKVRKTLRKITPKKRKSDFSEFFNSILNFFAVSGIAGFILFLAIGWGGISKQLEWGYFVNYLNQNVPTSAPATAPIASPMPTPIALATPDNLSAPSALPSLPSFPINNLRIAKLNISANVIWDVDESNILEQLKYGVAHYKGTSHPGEGGNVFVVGHSSNYPWIFSDYNTVFALLDKLAPGDRIELSDGSKNYVYEVKSTTIVKPDEVKVLDNTPKETLSLMTCWPVGTSLKRMLVQSELLYSTN